MRALFLLVALLTASEALAKWVRVPFEGVRPMGMGNAFVAVADDKNALWYNPAGLARISGMNFDLYDFIGGVDSLDTFNRLKGALLEGKTGDAVRADKQFARFGFFPTYVTKYFGLGLFYNLQSFIEIENFELPEIDLYGASDLGLITGFAIPIGDRITVGASVRAIQRRGIDVTRGSQAFLDELATTQDTFVGAVYDSVKGLIGSGWGLGATLGAQARIPLGKKGGRWQVGLSAEDVGQTTFHSTDGYAAPSPIRGSYNAGMALVLPSTPLSQFTFALDGRNLTDGLPPAKMLHVGAEWKLSNFSLRVGANQGYLSFGAGFENSVLRVQFATSATELGEGFLERFHRWYCLQFAMGLSLPEKTRKIK